MSNLKTLVRGAYDIQKLRIQMGNRVVGNWKAKLGQKPSAPEEEMDVKAKELLSGIRQSFSKITDGVTKIPTYKKFEGDEVISNYTELCLIRSYIALEKEEKIHFDYLKQVLGEYKIYTDFLKGVNGVGPAMAGVIIAEIDITKAKYPSSLWKYAGLDVAPDGKGRSRKKEHLVDSEYTDKEGEIKMKKGISFNPFLKTKLMGVLAASFLKVAESPYKVAYYEYKARLEVHPDHIEKSKGHRHNMAMRRSVKLFLVDLHIAWRTMEGLPVFPSYSEGKLKMEHAG